MAPIPFNPFKKPPLHTPTTTPIKATPKNVTPKNVTPKNVVDIRPSLADIREFPGYGLPLEHPGWRKDWSADHSAVLLWNHHAMTLRERCMLTFVNSITDKPDWNRKVFEEEILTKWKVEALEMDWKKAGVVHGDFSEKMFDYCVEELQDKALLFDKYGFVPILDVDATVVKTDSAVDATLKEALRHAVRQLEEVPENQKDWHPGSEGKVLDLVHPSLFPFVYGRSRILSDVTIDRNNCLDFIGKGEIVDDPRKVKRKYANTYETRADLSLYSKKFQWLPCCVTFPDGQNARIDSYINNLHPVDHSAMYSAIEQLITKAIPLWNVCLEQRSYISDEPNRIVCAAIEGEWPDDLPEADSLFSDYSDHSDLDQDDENYEEEVERRSQMKREQREEYIVKNRIMEKPEPVDSGPGYPDEKLQNPFNFLKEEDGQIEKKELQVIVKLANIHLTPEKPEYNGGSWHIEGQLNEHIVASAIYYYDNENVTDSHLSFRTRVDGEFSHDLHYEQGDYDGIFCIYGIENEDYNIQELGSVLTREDRMIAFPNVLQHRVGKFKLQDPTKPGHRKIVALFLVDPNIPIISTANVPPQQKDWWLREVAEQDSKVGNLPRELFDLVGLHVNDFSIGLEEAKRLREELMVERGKMDEKVEGAIADYEFSFCEH